MMLGFFTRCVNHSSKDCFNVVLLVADGIGDEIVDHIQIFDIGSFPSRKHRLINGSRLVYKKLRELSHIFFTFS